MRILGSRKKILIIFACILLVSIAGAGIYWQAANKKVAPPTVQYTEPLQIGINKIGMVPKSAIIKKDSSVEWKNDYDLEAQIASGPYPEQTDLPELASGVLRESETYRFTFTKTGTFTYYDRLNPTRSGTITVIE